MDKDTLGWEVAALFNGFDDRLSVRYASIYIDGQVRIIVTEGEADPQVFILKLEEEDEHS